MPHKGFFATGELHRKQLDIHNHHQHLLPVLSPKLVFLRKTRGVSRFGWGYWEFEGEDLGGIPTKINILGFIFNFQGVMLTQEHSGTTIHQQQGDFPFKHHNFSQWPMFSIGWYRLTIDFHPRCLCVDARQKRCLPGLGIGCLGRCNLQHICYLKVEWEKVPPQYATTFPSTPKKRQMFQRSN